MSLEYRIGDVRDRLAEIGDGTIDLIVTSPPFLALRSYLPADHPLKGKEIGSEATPAAFIDTLLALTCEFGRVLAPHGSLCVELGDTFSGSGGAGGDYNTDGWRENQPPFAGSGLANRGRKRAELGIEPPDRHARGLGWPLAKSLTGIPTIYPWSLAYGRNLLTGAESPAGMWRIRNIIVWARPNPPVGALGDKFRPATSYITVACRGVRRFFDLDAVRTEHTAPNAGPQRGRAAQPVGMNSDAGSEWASGERMDLNPAGAPPLDWHTDHHPQDGDWLWKLPTQPYKGAHYATFPLELPTRLIRAMCPLRVCVTCGRPSERITEHLGTERRQNPPSLEAFSRALTNGMNAAAITHHEVAERLNVSEAMVRHWLGKTGEVNHQLPSIRQFRLLQHFLPFGWDMTEAMTTVPPEYDTPDRGNRLINGRLSGGALPGDSPKVVATGWSDCGHNKYRVGRVLDPFAGSGTTLEAAQNVGRHAIGIDLDPRNAHLAQQRIGMFLEVDA